jgi:hypothetical protein
MTLHVYEEVEQGSAQWHDLRRGVVTASTVGKLLTVGAADVLEYKCAKCHGGGESQDRPARD